ncbi:MAG: MBL fold metallo-hydrolase [Thermoplasmatota archaeon]
MKRFGDSNIYLVGGPLAFPSENRPNTSWDCNQFLLKDEKSNSFDMVDAGHGLDFPAVLDAIRGVIDPKRIRTVVVTHEHLDHSNGVAHFQKLGATIACSPAAARKLAAGRDPASELFGGRLTPVVVERELQDGDIVALGGQPYQALLTPGHSPGSACHWNERSGTLFSGDTLFAEGGIGRFDFPDGDVKVEAASIARLARLPVANLHCGHGPSPEGPEALRSVTASLRHVESCL